MFDEKIQEIDCAVRLAVEASKDIEKIFELGVVLGQHLGKKGVDYGRLPFFIDRDDKKNTEEKIMDELNKSENLLQILIELALKRQIFESGSLELKGLSAFGPSVELFSSDVEESFFIKCESIRQRQSGGDFDLELMVTGQLKDIFNKFKIDCEIGYFFLNLDGEDEQLIENMEQLEDCMGRVSLHIPKDSSAYDENVLAEFYSELSKVVTWIKLKN